MCPQWSCLLAACLHATLRQRQILHSKLRVRPKLKRSWNRPMERVCCWKGLVINNSSMATVAKKSNMIGIEFTCRHFTFKYLSYLMHITASSSSSFSSYSSSSSSLSSSSLIVVFKEMYPPGFESSFKMAPNGCNGTVPPQKEKVMNHGELR